MFDIDLTASNGYVFSNAIPNNIMVKKTCPRALNGTGKNAKMSKQVGIRAYFSLFTVNMFYYIT